MIDALLVGSRAGWRTKLDPVLADYGIRVRWWWEARNETGAIPAGCGVVLVATDCNSHAVSEPAMRRAREAGIPVHTIVHRKAALVPMLLRAGFAPTHTPPTPQPPNPPTPEVSVPSLDNIPRDLLLMFLAEPFLTSRDLGERFPDRSRSALSRDAKVIRDAVGILPPTGSGAARIVDRACYEALCRSHGIAPETRNEGPVREWRTPDAAPEVTEPAPDPEPAPIVAPKPPAPKPPGAPLADVRAAVALLREAMAREGVEEILLTATTATVTRRVIVTETLD